MFYGSIVALVTPMTLNGEIDYHSLSQLIDFHCQQETDGIVVAGSTGESGTLTDKEKYDLIKFVVNKAAGRLPIIAGTGATSTRHATQLTQMAMDVGVDACLIMTPPYLKPTQEGLYQHFQHIAQQVAIPQILYNVPGRTACDLLPETIAKLAKMANIIGVKEASGQVERITEIVKLCGKNFLVYSGTDAINLDILAAGAQGVISVTANVAPSKMRQFCEVFLSGNTSLAEKLHHELMPLHNALFLQGNPIPVKWALYRMGMIGDAIRLPLIPLEPQYHSELMDALIATGVLPKEKTFM